MRGAQNRNLKRKLQEGGVNELPKLDRFITNINVVELYYLKVKAITIFKKWPCTLLARYGLSISFVWGPKYPGYVTHCSHSPCRILELQYRAVFLGRPPHEYVWICVYTNWYLITYLQELSCSLQRLVNTDMSNLTFVVPCIVINFYSKTNQMHSISNLFYFGTTLYMFRTVSLSIIRSLRLYTQHQVYVKQVLWLLANGNEMEVAFHFIPASSHITCMTYTWCCMYSLRLLMMDEETVRNM